MRRCEAAAELADRYISDRFLPDKAIDLIDEAASRMRIKSMTSPPVYRELEDEIEETRRAKEEAIEAQEFEKAANLRDKERRLTQKKRELAEQWEAGESTERPVDRRGGDRRHRLDVDRYPGVQADRGRDRQADADGGRAPQARDRPAPGDRGRLEGDPPLARGSEGPEAPDRLVHLPRPLGRRQDRARADARRVPVRRRGHDDPDRHVRVHGEARRLAAGRLASGLHRLRRGRPADRGRAAQALQRAAARRDREGPPRRLQHPAADPGGRAADRRSGPDRRLPPLHRDHDLEHRRRRDRAQHAARASPSPTTRPGSPTTT